MNDQIAAGLENYIINWLEKRNSLANSYILRHSGQPIDCMIAFSFYKEEELHKYEFVMAIDDEVAMFIGPAPGAVIIIPLADPDSCEKIDNYLQATQGCSWVPECANPLDAFYERHVHGRHS